MVYGQSCANISQTQIRTCNNGTWSAWSGTYQYLTCSVQSASACGTIASGAFELRTMYQAAAINEGQNCISEIQNRLCTNGQLGSWSGTYTQPKCVISRVRYESSLVNAGVTCKSETQQMICENAICGNWAPNNYSFAQCALITGTEDEYTKFNNFAKTYFRAEREEQYYAFFGNSLTIIESQSWSHISVNSAAISFHTSLPVLSKIEYGKTTSYGNSTEYPDRNFFQHLHYLKNLEANTIYHYRIVTTDERGIKVVSGDKTFTTKSLSNVVLIPGSLGNPPYILNKENTIYLLTQDIITNTRGFTIAANNITLDLNGHTLVYDNGVPLVENAQWNDYVYSTVSSFGIFSSGNKQGSKILNGTIKQGSHNSQGSIGLGFNPIHVDGLTEIAGITVEYGGHSVGGIMARYGDHFIHHNVIKDKGTGIDNRHQGVKALWVSGSKSVNNNLIVRARHQGIMISETVPVLHNNEVYIDSWDTNSFAIQPTMLTRDNKIFGTGYHVNGISWRNGIVVRNNFIFLQGDAPNNRSSEYGAMASVNGIRLTQYSGGTKPYENNLYENNAIIIRGREGSTSIRGVQFFSDPYVKNLIFRNNTVKTFADDDKTKDAFCVVGQGLSERYAEQLPIYYNNNTFLSNYGIIQLGDSYGMGGNHQFRNSKFVKLGNNPNYKTVRIGFWTWHSIGNLFIDTKLEGGANFDDFGVSGSGNIDFSVGDSMYLVIKDSAHQIIANQVVEISDSYGKSFSGMTDSLGKIKVEIVKYTFTKTGTNPGTKVFHTNHAIIMDHYINKNITFSANTLDNPLEIILISN